MKYPQVVPRISGDGSDFLISFGLHAHQKNENSTEHSFYSTPSTNPKNIIYSISTVQNLHKFHLSSVPNF
jgi:hypothetical protein